MSIVKKRFLTLFLGILFLVCALLLKGFEIIRLLFVLISIVLLTYSNQLERENKKLFIPLFVIIFFFFVVALDYLSVAVFKKAPILSFSIVSTTDGTIYNALGYRVWSCRNSDFKVDPLYKIGYFCQKESLTAESINNVLDDMQQNFDRYKDNYVKITGRVKQVVDNKTFIMQNYNETNNEISFKGINSLYVAFDLEQKDMANLKATTPVTVIGRISKLDGHNIYMIDSSFQSESIGNEDVSFSADSNIYCEFDKQLWFQTEDNIYYKSCIDDVNLTINDNQYNLQNAIKNNIITLQEIENEALGYQKNSKDESVIYKFKNFNILVCDPNNSKDVVVGRDTLEFSDGYCNSDLTGNDVGV